MVGNFKSENLIDDVNNKEAIDLLFNDFNQFDDFVVFVGAGIPANMKSVPTWSELYDLMNKEMNANLRKPFDNEESFSKLYNKIQEDQKKVFYSTVFNSFDNHNLPPGIYDIMYQACSSFVTTNFDSFFEHKERLLNVNYFSLPEKESKGEKYIVYLHGHRNLGFCILRTEDYDYFYPSRNNRKNRCVYAIEETLEKLYTGRRLIFIGTSIEKTILDYFEKINQGIESDSRHHYWITSKVFEDDKDKAKFIDKYRKLSIYPILYKDTHHVFIDDLFRALRTVTNKKNVSDLTDEGDILYT